MAVDKDLVSVQQARDLVEAAHQAQGQLARFDQARIDRICEAMAQAALREAERLGKLAVEETGYGIPADKREKNRFAAEDVWHAFKGLRTVGVISESKDVIEIASPRGVVAGIIPSTNPTSTAIFKILIAIKSRNAIVLSPHPSAAKCINETARVMRDAAVKEGLPVEAIGCMANATIEGTEALMKHKRTAVILATGGIGLVRAAYSSGKPAFGVGPGNVPVFVERTADVPLAVQNILTGKCFDNGTICASEQAIVADAPVAKQVREELVAQGAYFLSASDADKLGKIVATPQRSLNPQIVGKSVQVIAQMSGLSVPPDTRCLVAEVGGVGREYPLSMEKLSPILAFYVEDGVARGAARCFEILKYGGMGHTAGVHTRSREMAKAYGMEMPASRVVVNTPTTHGAIGFSTALPPSMTLGCGSWGGNVTSDNISPLHLMDIKRVAFETRPVPSARPARKTGAQPSALMPATTQQPQPVAAAPTGARISREDVAAIVDRFLTTRGVGQPAPPSASPPATAPSGGNGGTTQTAPPAAPAAKPVATAAVGGAQAATTNGHKAVEFVSEDDVRRAIQKGEKIYVNARTIITPSARDLGEPAEVFAKA
jgi:acetaldehyde dehydrogenase (acetylating)